MTLNSDDKYEVLFVQQPDSKFGRIEIRNIDGAILSTHYKFNLIDASGSVIDTPKISTLNQSCLISSLKLRGITEGFYLSEIELKNKEISRHVFSSNINNVRHKKTKKEKMFTATGDKLAYHLPIIEKYAKTGYGSIIRATMTLHQKCSSRCPYCSTMFRKKEDSINLEEAKQFIKSLYYDQAKYNIQYFQKYNNKYKNDTGSDIRLRGLILSGGGQPNLWPHFTKFTSWLSTLDIDLGLITNGFPKNVPEEIYSSFLWIRLSITPEDASPHYINKKFNLQYIPSSIVNNDNLTFGLSYVYGPWTTDDILLRINDFIEQVGAKYCRFLTDCNLGRRAQLKAHEDLAERLYKLDLIGKDGNPQNGIFHQLKYHGTQEEAKNLWHEGQCYLQAYNVFWDTSGHSDNGVSYCYPCDSVTVLADDTQDSTSERCFNPNKWGTVTNNNVSDLYKKKVKPYFDPRLLCSSCLFMKNNKIFKKLSLSNHFDLAGKHPSLDHVNFP